MTDCFFASFYEYLTIIFFRKRSHSTVKGSYCPSRGQLDTRKANSQYDTGGKLPFMANRRTPPSGLQILQTSYTGQHVGGVGSR